MTRWRYGWAVFDGTAVERYESLGEIGSPTEIVTLLECAGAHGWEYCGTAPVPSWMLAGFQGEGADIGGPLLLIFKRPL